MKILHFCWTTLGNKITYWKKWPSRLRVNWPCETIITCTSCVVADSYKAVPVSLCAILHVDYASCAIRWKHCKKLQFVGRTTPRKNSGTENCCLGVTLLSAGFCASELFKNYCQTSNVKWTKSPNYNISCLILQLSLSNPFKPGVKSRMMM